MSILSADIVLTIARWLKIADIYMLGGTCKPLRTIIRKNGVFWKNMVTGICPTPLWSFLPLEPDDYLEIMINNKTPENKVFDSLLDEAKRQYILHRLKLPMNNLQALRINLMISTDGIPETVSLMGKVDTDDEYLSKQIDRLRDFRLSEVKIKEEEDEEVDVWKMKFSKRLCTSSGSALGSSSGSGLGSSSESNGLSRSGVHNLDGSGEGNNSQTTNGQNTNDSEPKVSIPFATRMTTWAQMTKKKPFLIQSEKDRVFSLVFERPDGKAFLLWNGEEGKYSQEKFYVLDRSKKTAFNVKEAPSFRYFQHSGGKRVETSLSTDNCNHIYALLKKNINEENKGIIQPRDQNLFAVGEVRNGNNGNGIDGRGQDMVFLRFGSMLLNNRNMNPVMPRVKAYKSWIVKIDFVKWFDEELAKTIPSFVQWLDERKTIDQEKRNDLVA